jgi:phosphoribosylformimino-5-aminoimidazole carboxamide ribotide isomerase
VIEIIPAIDLLGGRCVRLSQGDYDRVSVYGDDPGAVAAAFVAAGAPRVHVVDLDGARAGRPVQLELVAGVIVGRALYTGAVDLGAAMAAVAA